MHEKLVVDFNDMLIYLSDYLISSDDFPQYVNSC